MRSIQVALFLAVKSLARGNIGVTLLTITMLVLVNLNLLFVPSLVNGIIFSANQKLITTYSSNIIIESGGDSPFINDAGQLVSQIEKLDGVVAATYRNSMAADLSLDEMRSSCIVRGIPPESYRNVFQIADYMYEGQYLDSKDSDQILLGIQVAGAGRSNLELYTSSLKNVHAGDKITVSYANGIRKQYRVKGIFYTEFIMTDLQAFVTEREFRSLNPLADNRAAVINVKIQNEQNSANIIREISKLRDNLKFSTWRDAAGLVLSMTNSFDIINSILLIVNLLIAGITVFIVTYIDLTHKRKQIGIERAIGITPAAISLSYVLRAFWYGIIGVIVSYLVYTYAVVPLEAIHPFHFPFGDVALFLDVEQIVRSAVIILAVAMLAAYLPVRQTIRIKLLDAIWG